MNTLRILFHLARGDVLERVRSYSFLITLGLALFLGYAIARGQLVLVIGSHYRGVLNSAWVAGLMATMINFFLGLFGFYLVKGSVARDYETGVGQIMATTPLPRPLYTLGKWLSNLVVYAAMVFILLLMTLGMQLLYGEDATIDFGKLLAPFLLLVLPFLACIAALAVLFETIEWLRGGLGNVIYFFVYTFLLIMLSVWVIFGAWPMLDLVGIGILNNSMGEAARAVYPDCKGGFAITGRVPNLQTFRWDGVAWSADLVLSRLALLVISCGIAVLASVFFDRFNPSRLGSFRRQRSSSNNAVEAQEVVPARHIHLTPLASAGTDCRFLALFITELKLLLKGQRWWWYGVACLLVMAQLFSGPGAAHVLLLVAWVWPCLALSRLGCRERRFNTGQLVFSAPHPIARQLPATWLSAVAVIALLGSGMFLRLILSGDWVPVLGWLTGMLFIPSLALACGVLSGSSKAFEVLYVVWMYLISQKMSPLDFIGLTPGAPLRIYFPLAILLLVVTLLTRHWQFKRGIQRS